MLCVAALDVNIHEKTTNEQMLDVKGSDHEQGHRTTSSECLWYLKRSWQVAKLSSSPYKASQQSKHLSQAVKQISLKERKNR